MYSKSFAKSLNYKLRELELIIRHLDSDDEISRIDVDLALDKTRELYEILLKADKMEPGGKERNTVSSRKAVVPSDPETFQEDREYEAEGIIPDPVHKQKEQPQPEQDKPELQIREVKEGEGQTVAKAEDGPEKEEPSGRNKNGTQDVEIVADRYQFSQNYINRAMEGKQPKKDLTARMQSKPISDLRNSIGLNEKFLFIKELFKGRPEQYNQCIDTLNQISSFDEAISYIRENYSWEEDNEVVEKLVNLVKRKHQAD